MLNSSLEFSQKLTIEELEEDIREEQNKDYMEGRSTHFFSEITSILEYLPEGFELDQDEAPETKEVSEPELQEIEGIEEEVEDDIEADETMKWDEEDEDEEDQFEETTSPPES